ncbi:MAG: hypothetical protein WC289_05065 [Patescibacteria group bacterium]|jgi:hypothetical protein
MDQPSEQPVESTQPKPKPGRKFGYIISIIFNIAFYYIANNLLSWNAQFITDQWSEVLDIMNISIIVNIIGFAIFVIFDRRLFYFLVRSGMDVLSLIVSYRVYTVFPFDFNGLWNMGWLNSVFPWVLIIGIIGIVLGIIVRTAKFAANKNIHY